MPLITPSRDVTVLVSRARMLLGLTQVQLADRLGASRRTASRWEAGQRYPSLDQLRELARAVYPLDATLASALVTETGTTLEALGIVAPAPPPQAETPPPVVVPPPIREAAVPPPRPFPAITLMVDSILFAAMQVAQTQSSAPGSLEHVSAILRAAFGRADALGLTSAEVSAVLAEAGRAQA